MPCHIMPTYHIQVSFDNFSSLIGLKFEACNNTASHRVLFISQMRHIASQWQHFHGKLAPLKTENETEAQEELLISQIT